MKIYYVYRITNLIERKHYYGYRSTDIDPKLDLGISYFSSSTDEEFLLDQEQNPQNYKYKIVRKYYIKDQALDLEIFLHNKFDVAKNPNFYNKVKQTSKNFDTTGKVNVVDSLGNRSMVSVVDPRYLSGELTFLKVGYCAPEREFSEQHRINLSLASKGKPKSKEHIENCKQARKELGIDRGSKHPRFKRYYITPLGIIDSPKALQPIISMTQIKSWCIKNSRIISQSAYKQSKWLQSLGTFEFLKSKTYKDLGFSIIPKEDFIKD